jgi:hypothetical protein
MSFREPSLQESFPLAHQKDLLKLQSTHLINNSLSKGGIAQGLKELPTNITVNETHNRVVLDEKMVKPLIRNYLKHNWKVMLVCSIIGGIIIYTVIKINQERKKEKRLK